ncbi:O-succinylhomoserine sulfhydrylase [Georgenia sp. EYE_87]|uniref:O-succinylhomoserine sulfhydrylase n=1 Tax=Georgenia sp. EYE_87 TaxID=2853448 RepID=UPI002004AA6B|nr:O-succinylhomoserine sulfhydrylase [Georgenia sp. EYE_87]MCK6211844.1 O-succinylhomoserine sulfhydrylase [Georgenia sp. EYE_87]
MSDLPACPSEPFCPPDLPRPAVDPAGLRPGTLAVRGGQYRSAFQETSEALYLTQGFVYDRAAEAEAAFAEEIERYTYSRYTNPTVTTFEERLALIEGAEDCYATSTGMSAVFTALAALVSSGSRVVAARELFGSTLCVFDDILARWGVRTDYVTGTDLDQWAAALATPADVVFLESPSNPMQDVLDLPAIARLAHAAGATVIVDNVFATPVLQRPLELGADVVVYSATKHIDGQGRVMGGAILGTRELVRGPVQSLIRSTGPNLAPFNAWVLAKGLETLPLRVRAQTATALELARWLEQQPGVASVRYPFLASHPQHDLARAQMSGGGTVVTFTLDGSGLASADPAARADVERTFAFLDALRVVDISNNLGDAKSMVTHPATTTHRRVDPVTRDALGIVPTTVRFSVGLEDVEDLREDLDAALAVFRGVRGARAPVPAAAG